jgi:hypothetical protein
MTIMHVNIANIEAAREVHGALSDSAHHVADGLVCMILGVFS